MKLLFLLIRNLFFLANKALVTALGFDPRMTISAIVHLKGWTWLERVIDEVYFQLTGQFGHCAEAARGWDNPAAWGGIDRSVPLWVAAVFWSGLVAVWWLWRSLG